MQCGNRMFVFWLLRTLAPACSNSAGAFDRARVKAPHMSTTEIVILVVVAGVVLLIVGNVVFSMLSERNNPPVGSFIECDGVRLHYLDRGDPSAPCVVLFHGNGMMIQDFMISGLLE